MLIRTLFCALFLSTALLRAEEKLGVVHFENSCSAASQAGIDRGIALLHDFWYDEAQRQFSALEKSDKKCAIAHWGEAMSAFKQIWFPPSEKDIQQARGELKKAEHLKTSERERGYVEAALAFFGPKKLDFQHRVNAYESAMADLHGKYPKDVDAATFYALSVLASHRPDDASVDHEQKALAVLKPLYEADPEHPGVLHYIIHACDNPQLAPQGLEAAKRYGSVAPSGAHAVHMPGHIFSRLGMWKEDIEVNELSVKAAQAAMESGHGMGMDQVHSDEFLIYAFLQTGDVEAAKKTIVEGNAAIAHLETMGSGMSGMFNYRKAEFPAIFAIETHDWKAAEQLPFVDGAKPVTNLLTLWARMIGAGHLGDAAAADQIWTDIEKAKAEAVKSGDGAAVTSVGGQVNEFEVEGWRAFAKGNDSEAAVLMRKAADLQDKVGQAEVDIPAREMLGDILLESKHASDALTEYRASLKLSPNRLNGLEGAWRAAKASGDDQSAAAYHAQLPRSVTASANP